MRDFIKAIIIISLVTILSPAFVLADEPQDFKNRPLKLEGNVTAIGNKSEVAEEEYSVSWDTWRHKIADAVWTPLKAKGAIIWGMTRVDYDVTRDRHIHITSVHTPDPSGKSGQLLAKAIMRLDGKKILEFPKGSQQMIHHNDNMQIGLPAPARTGYTLHVPGGIEHVVKDGF